MKNPKKIFLALMCIGLVFSLYLNFQRSQVERANRQVETVMDYQALKRLAVNEGASVDEVLDAFKQRGVTTLAVYDKSLMTLADEGRVVYYTGGELLRAAQLGSLAPQWQAVVDAPDFTTQAVYIADGKSPRTLDAIREVLSARYDSDRFRQVAASPRIYRMTGPTTLNKNPFYQDQMGFQEAAFVIDPEEVETVKKHGFLLAVRPGNPVATTKDKATAEKQIQTYFRQLDRSGAEVSLLIGNGKSMFGEARYKDLVAKEMAKRHITLGMVENDIQLQFIRMDGLTAMAPLVDYQVARAYLITEDEQRKMKIFDAFRRWSLSDRERNIRINYIRSFMSGRDGMTPLETNLDYVSQVTEDVTSHGFSSGRADIYAVYQPSRLLYIPLAFSLMAAWGLYLCLLGILPEKRYLPFTVLCGALLSAGYFTGSHALLFRQMTALGAAVIFPVLSMARMMRIWDGMDDRQSLGSVIGKTVVSLFGALVFSLVGASLLGGVLSDTRFLLELDIYRGVKLTFMLPVLLVSLLFIKQHGLWNKGESLWVPVRRIQQFLSNPFTLKTLAILFCFAVVAWVFIGRSGHTAGVPVPAIEEKLRYFLEETLYARPREKEFLIGHPAFFLAAWAAWHKLPARITGLFVTAAAIGQGSAVQTFAHMRTPIVMSYARALGGYVLGAVAGIAAVLIFEFAFRHLMNLLRRRDAVE